MSVITRVLMVIGLIAQFATAAYGEEKSVRTYRLPGHGVLELSVPKSWKDEVRQPSKDLPPTISFSPGTGDEFSILITPLWDFGSAKDLNSDAKIKKLMEGDMRGMAPGAVEKRLVLTGFKGAETRGYYFQATDKAPKPGEWRYVVRSGVGTGDLLLSITMLSHKKESEAINDALKMFRNLRQRM